MLKDWSQAQSWAICAFHSGSSVSCLSIHLFLMQQQFLLISASVKHRNRVCDWKYSAVKIVSVFESWPGWTTCFLVGEWGSIKFRVLGEHILQLDWKQEQQSSYAWIKAGWKRRKFRGDIYFAKFSLAFLFCDVLDFVSFPDVPLQFGSGAV